MLQFWRDFWREFRRSYDKAYNAAREERERKDAEQALLDAMVRYHMERDDKRPMAGRES